MFVFFLLKENCSNWIIFFIILFLLTWLSRAVGVKLQFFFEGKLLRSSSSRRSSWQRSWRGAVCEWRRWTRSSPRFWPSCRTLVWTAKRTDDSRDAMRSWKASGDSILTQWYWNNQLTHRPLIKLSRLDLLSDIYNVTKCFHFQTCQLVRILRCGYAFWPQKYAGTICHSKLWKNLVTHLSTHSVQNKTQKFFYSLTNQSFFLLFK